MSVEIFTVSATSALSAVIGIRGRRINKTEINAIAIKSRVETSVITSVKLSVFPNNFEECNLFTAVIAEKNKRGTTVYRPSLITKSVIAERIDVTAEEFAGNISAMKNPKIIPIRYFIQSFIL